MPDFIIYNTTILSMDEGKPHNVIQGNLHIKDGIITGIAPPSLYNSTENNKRETALIDGSNLIIMPGLVNCHGHAAMSLFRGIADDLPLHEWLIKNIWPKEFRLKKEDVYWGTMLSIAEMIRSGTTTFTDMYFLMEEVAKAIEVSGMRGVLSRGMGGIGIMKKNAWRETNNLINNWQGKANGRIKIILGPHAVYTCSPDYLKKIRDFAAKVNLPLQIHLSETKWEVDHSMKKYGLTPVEMLNNLGIFEHQVICSHCVHLSINDLRIFENKKPGIVHNPSSNLKLGSGIAPVKTLLEAGLNVGLGTDGAASNNNLNMFEEMHIASLLAKGINNDPTQIPARTSLEMATCKGAEILGIQKIGRIKEGYRADIIGINKKRPHLSPLHEVEAQLVYSAIGSDVELVMVDGKLLMNKGELLTLDEERIMHEAEKRAFRFKHKGITNLKTSE